MSSNFFFAALALTATYCSGNPVIILDDLDGEAVSRSNAHQGSYAPCLQDAYNGQFVHDWAQDKGKVSTTYSFDPPKDGCYMVEEHHPGGEWDCSRYLPKAAKLEVGYCMGKTQDVSVDQSINGGQWNTIGKWPFFKGHKGYFKMSNSQDDSCAMGNCFWVADAFRVTWMGRNCKEVNSAMTQTENEEDEQAEVVQSEEDNTQSAPAPALMMNAPMQGTWTQGTVSMVIATSNGDTADLKLTIKNLGILETALQAHFGYKSVNVLSLDVSTARRLAASSPAWPSTHRINAVFESQGNGEKISKEQTLMEQVQALFDANDAGILVKSVSVSFGSPSTNEPVDASEKDATEFNVALVVSLAVAFGVSLLMVVGYMKMLRNKKAFDQAVTENGSISMYPEVVKDPEMAAEADKEKNEEDLDVVSVSTAPPPTDSDAGSETGSATQSPANSSEMP